LSFPSDVPTDPLPGAHGPHPVHPTSAPESMLRTVQSMCGNSSHNSAAPPMHNLPAVRNMAHSTGIS